MQELRAENKELRDLLKHFSAQPDVSPMSGERLVVRAVVDLLHGDVYQWCGRLVRVEGVDVALPSARAVARGNARHGRTFRVREVENGARHDLHYWDHEHVRAPDVREG